MGWTDGHLIASGGTGVGGLLNLNLVFLFGLVWIFEAVSCSVLGWFHTYGKSSHFSL